MIKARCLTRVIKKDALKDGKIAFVSGPRQVGKTTMGKQLLKSPGNYFSYDQTNFRKMWAKRPEGIIERAGAGPVLLDEIHKDRRWKRCIMAFLSGPIQRI